MAVPALAWFGSHYLKQEFLAPSVAGDKVACLGVSEAGAGSDVASIKTVAMPKKGVFIQYHMHVILTFAFPSPPSSSLQAQMT